MKRTDMEMEDTMMYPHSETPAPGRQEKPKRKDSQEEEDENDPLFEEEELPEDFEEEEDEDEYEINDRISEENLADIYDYICCSL